MKLKTELAEPLAALQDTARAIAEVQRECKLEIVPDDYVESFKPFLMDVIHAWSKVQMLKLLGSRQLDMTFADNTPGCLHQVVMEVHWTPLFPQKFVAPCSIYYPLRPQ